MKTNNQVQPTETSGELKPVILATVNRIDNASKLKGKKVIITAGNSSLATSLARKFILEGATVLLTGEQSVELEQTAAGLGCLYCPLDLANTDDIARFITEADKLLGGVNGLVNIVNRDKQGEGILQVEVEEFNQQIGVSLRGHYFLTQHFVKLAERTKRRDSGVLFITPTHSTTPDDSPHGLTKVIINSLIQGLTVRFLLSGIRVNGITPDICDTSHDKVAETAAFFLSDASRCISGQLVSGLPVY